MYIWILRKTHIAMSAAVSAPCALARASAAAPRGVRGSPTRGLGARAWSRLSNVSRRRSDRVTRASIESDEPFPYPAMDRTAKTLTLQIGDSQVTIETGRIGRQANGAVMVTEGETVMYATICAGREVTADGGFVPLTVNYQERFSAVGKTAGGYRKRDGGVRENETLVGRLVDRPLRPMIPKGWAYDTQILQWVLSYDGVRSTDALAITAASAVAAISDVPLTKPVAGVRVGWLPGANEPLINPTCEQMKTSRLDLVLAGTEDAVMMIEGFGDFLTVDEMLYAIEKGHEAAASACRAIGAWALEVGREKKIDKMLIKPDGVDDAVANAVGKELATAMAIGPKQLRGAAVEKVRNIAMDALKDTYKVRTTTKTSLAFFYFFPNLLFSQKTTFDAHSPKGPRRVPFVGPRAWAQLPRAQSKLHGRFERTLGPPWGRTRVLPKALLCTRLKSSSFSFFLLLFHKGVRIMSFYFLHELTHKPYPHPHQASDVRLACGKIESQAIRDSIRLRNRRQDGRDTKTVRPITCEGGLLPRVHGSSLFTRGETQAIAVATLGGKADAQRTDGISDNEDRRFYLHYFFPPSSVGETGRMGPANRREVGHGNLAERALAPIIPSEADFPFTVRLESTITESNGSSSMATVCAGCLALQDAGVPITRFVDTTLFSRSFLFFLFFTRPPEARSLRTLSVAIWYGERSSHNRARITRGLLRGARGTGHSCCDRTSLSRACRTFFQLSFLKGFSTRSFLSFAT